MEDRSRSTADRTAWGILLGTVALVPLAVSKWGFMARPLTISPFTYPQVVALLVGAALALAAWGIHALRHQPTLMASRALVPFGLLALWTGIATVAGLDPLRSLLGSSTSAVSLAGIVACLALAWVATQVVASTARLRTLTWVVVAASAVVAVIALIQQAFLADLFGVGQLEPWRLSRGFSTLGNPDYVGAFLLPAVFLAAFLYLGARTTREKVFSAISLWLCFAAGTGTLTRSAWIASLLGIAIVALLAWRLRMGAEARKRLSIALALCVLAVATVLALTHYPVAARFQSAAGTGGGAVAGASASDNATGGRVSLWRSALRIAEQRPLTGTGPAAFELGWYPNAVNPSKGTFVTDPHSVVMLALATLGVPGLLLLLACFAAVSLPAVRYVWSFRADASGDVSAASLYYTGWLVAMLALYAVLAVGTLTPPALMLSFLGAAVLLRPTLRPATAPQLPLVGAAIAVPVAVAVLVAVFPNLSAEVAVARAVTSQTPASARNAALGTTWNLDLQTAYYSARIAQIQGPLGAGSTDALATVDALSADLIASGQRRPHEHFFPATRLLLLERASEVTGDADYAEQAVQASDAALAIMPGSIVDRVNRALVLSDLKRYDEMAETLAGYWEKEFTSSYPGVLYAQALALSGRADDAWRVFDELQARFPGDSSVISARQQTEQLVSGAAGEQ